jgi:TRAP-type mannitol/chloroaromatic compound transport system permease large subunit
MSQHEMHYEELNRGQSEASYGGYEGAPHYDNRHSTGLYGQKLSSAAPFKTPSTGQRLLLALLSLLMLMLTTFGLIFIGILTNANNDAMGGAGLCAHVILCGGHHPEHLV